MSQSVYLSRLMDQVKNQLHPPKKKNKEKVELNKRKSIYYKDGTSTMLFVKDVTIPMSKLVVSSVKTTLERLGVSMKGNFIITN